MNPAFRTFARRGWKRSRRGNFWKRLGTGEIVTLFRYFDSWKVCYVMSDDTTIFSDPCPTLLAAKLVAFQRFAEYLNREYAR